MLATSVRVRLAEAGAVSPTEGAAVSSGMSSAMPMSVKPSSEGMCRIRFQRPTLVKSTAATWKPRTPSGKRAKRATTSCISPGASWGSAVTPMAGNSTSPTGPSMTMEMRCIPGERSGVPRAMV